MLTSLPTRWTKLQNEDGELDFFLLTPLGRVGPNIDVAAIRGSYGTDADPADLVLYMREGDSEALILTQPVQRVAGDELGNDALAIIGQFISANRTALARHWTGQTDSVELLDEITGLQTT